jgi:hypothetical protein
VRAHSLAARCAGSVVNLLVHNQKEARQVRMQESERKKRIAMEEQAKRSRQEKIRVQAKLEEKYALQSRVCVRAPRDASCA